METPVKMHAVNPALEVKAHPAARLVVRALLGLFGLIPVRVRDALAVGLGRLVFALGVRRAVTLDNLRHAFPEKPEAERRKIAQGAYVNMARVANEALFSLRLSNPELEDLVRLENWSLIDGALAQGRGALLATAHFGNWELMGEAITRRGIPLSAVVRPLKGALNEVIMENRFKSGLNLIPPKGAIAAALGLLAKNGLVAQLVDQVSLSPNAVFVPFFGRLAATTPALSVAAVRSGAPVFVLLAARGKGHLTVLIEGPIPVPQTGDEKEDVLAHTALIAASIERFIRRYPDQWMWLHRRWKRAPPEAGTRSDPPTGSG